MIVALLTAVILYFSIQLLQRDRDAADFGTAFAIVFVSGVILVLGNIAIGLMELNPLLGLIPMLLALASIFLMSKSIFEWGNKKSFALCGIYLVSLIGLDLGVAVVLA